MRLKHRLRTSSRWGIVAGVVVVVAGTGIRLSSDQHSGASSAQVNADNAAVAAAQNVLTNAENSQDESTLTAPITGTVGAVNLAVGQQVAGAGSSSGALASSTSSAGASSSGGGESAAGGEPSGADGGASSGSSSSDSSGSQVVVSNGSYLANSTVDDTEVGLIKDSDQTMITRQHALLLSHVAGQPPS